MLRLQEVSSGQVFIKTTGNLADRPWV